MASRHQGGLGRGFGEFFQTSVEVDPDSPAESPDADPTRRNTEEPRSSTATPPAYRGGTRTDDTTGTAPTQTDHARATDGAHRPSAGRVPAPVSDDGEPPVAGPGTPLVGDSRLELVPVNVIHPNPRQPRRSFDEKALLELSESIAEVGLLQPVVVRPDGANYELVMGERRWRAARLSGLETIPAIVRGTEAKDLLRDALLENLHRAQLNPLEEAAAYQQLLDDFDCTQDELSRRIKRSRPQIANTLRLLKLPRSVQRHLIEGSLTAGHARALLGAHEAEEQVRIAEKIVDEGLSVRATEALVKAANDSRTTVKPHVRRKPGSDEEAVQLATRLADVYDTEVKVKRSKGRGSIVLAFESDEDLERLVGILDRG